jgi:hypothetical protein
MMVHASDTSPFVLSNMRSKADRFKEVRSS